MTCADAIAHVLENAIDGMRAADIARQINQERLYERGDGQSLPAYQVSSIAHANRDRFRIADGVIALQTQGATSAPAGRRDRHRASSPRTARRPKSVSATDGTRVILLGCVKQKHDHQAAAKDLYRSRLWTARRSYAEASGRPWLILSAKHGLLDPDARISPYDVELRTLSATERRDWGERTVRELEQRLGPLSGMTFEVHAGAAYRRAIEPGLERLGANLDAPLARLSIGRQPAWYRTHAPTPGSPATSNDRQRQATSAEFSEVVRALGNAAAARVSASAWPGVLQHLDQPGLYSWWVDVPGALALSEGLGHEIAPGLIYAGQTGATKWPSGPGGPRSTRSESSIETSVAFSVLPSQSPSGIFTPALRRGIRDVFGEHALVHRCHRHQERNVCDLLPERDRTQILARIRGAWALTNPLLAQERLELLAAELDQTWPDAAGSLREGMDDTLTLMRLGIDGQLAKTLSSTNPCESMIEIVRYTQRNVKRWQHGDMRKRWTAAAMLVAEQQFRRIIGYRDLAKLVIAIERHTLLAAETNRDRQEAREPVTV
jgi:hypothetical protein